ncbi:hypothetical protein D5086_032647 [Populus alba]|uniref:Uncharacterized protein n=1 Tax=Populus alba TaxID=43335 RepID=A0ACC4AEM1_POPAL
MESMASVSETEDDNERVDASEDETNDHENKILRYLHHRSLQMIKDFLLLNQKQALITFAADLAAHFITHDPAEEEVAWMKNTLLGVINEATDLPITVWNVSSNNKIISAYGRAIGFDKINLWYSNLGHIDLLIGTRLNRFIKEHTTLWLNGKDYKIKLQELDPLHYLVSEAIEYSTAAFDLMKQEDESETDTLMLKMLTRLQLKAVHIWLI